MVDVNAIQELLDKHFIIMGTTHIDAETGVVDVEGKVGLVRRVAQMPVQFGTVTGSFTCSEYRLESLVGAPHTVGKDFSCGHNRLTSLEGGPVQVGGRYDCRRNPLNSLDGLPQKLGDKLSVFYSKDLPLLSLLDIPKDQLVLDSAPKKVEEILDHYAGHPELLLDCGVALKDAGYEGNARW
jgi:hypothetical protein